MTTGEQIKGAVITVLISALISLPVSFMSVKLSLQFLETEVFYVKRDVQELVDLKLSVIENRTAIMVKDVRFENFEKRLVKLEVEQKDLLLNRRQVEK